MMLHCWETLCSLFMSSLYGFTSQAFPTYSFSSLSFPSGLMHTPGPYSLALQSIFAAVPSESCWAVAMPLGDWNNTPSVPLGSESSYHVTPLFPFISTDCVLGIWSSNERWACLQLGACCKTERSFCRNERKQRCQDGTLKEEYENPRLGFTWLSHLMVIVHDTGQFWLDMWNGLLWERDTFVNSSIVMQGQIQGVQWCIWTSFCFLVHPNFQTNGQGEAATFLLRQVHGG